MLNKIRTARKTMIVEPKVLADQQLDEYELDRDSRALTETDVGLHEPHAELTLNRLAVGAY